MVNEQTLEGHWKQIHGAVLEKWGTLSDGDLQTVRGNVDQLIGVIQQKAGVSREKIEAFLDRVVSESQSVLDRSSETAQHVATAVREQCDQVTDQVAVGYREAESVVRHRPAESVAVAFGAGLIAGVITTLFLKAR
jgi:uncharacterized protein YjbJ (UPF0337 family)